MTDYIKREDVVDLGVMMQTHLWTREQTYNAIFCLPSADVAPVVRCGDCKFCQIEIYEGADEPWCDVHRTTVDTEDFCSWGKEKQ